MVRTWSWLRWGAETLGAQQGIAMQFNYSPAEAQSAGRQLPPRPQPQFGYTPGYAQVVAAAAVEGQRQELGRTVGDYGQLACAQFFALAAVLRCRQYIEIYVLSGERFGGEADIYARHELGWQLRDNKGGWLFVPDYVDELFCRGGSSAGWYGVGAGRGHLVIGTLFVLHPLFQVFQHEVGG